jgi:hypothetical protein
MHTVFLLENLKGRDRSEDLGVGGRIIFKWIIKEIRREGVDWNFLAQDWDQWRVLFNMVMNSRIP